MSDCLFGSLLNNWLQIDVPAITPESIWVDLILIHSGCVLVQPLGCFGGLVLIFIAKTLLFYFYGLRCSVWIYYQVGLEKIGWRVLKQKADCGELHGRLQHGFSGTGSNNTQDKCVRNYCPHWWEQGSHTRPAAVIQPKRYLFCWVNEMRVYGWLIMYFAHDD